MPNSPVEFRDALLRQWGLLAEAADALDLDLPSRVRGWRNREVLGHLAIQPLLLRRFLASATFEPARVTLEENLAGTVRLASVINEAALDPGRSEKIPLRKNIDEAVQPLIATGRRAAPDSLKSTMPLMS